MEAHPQVACLNEPFTMHTSVFLPGDLIRWDHADYRSEILHQDLIPTTASVMPTAVPSASPRRLVRMRCTSSRG